MLAKLAKQLQMGTNMNSNDLKAKLNAILKAFASGHSCEQILAEDRTLSYRDIFHAIAEAPTTYWDRTPAERTGDGAQCRTDSTRAPARQRTD